MAQSDKNSHEETKDTFYEQLEHTYDSIPRYYTKIIVGDLNARVGREEEYKQTAGSYSLHENSNNNGVRLINFAIGKGMVISSTRLPKKDIYKHTWTSPGGRFNSQIDHVVIDKRHKSSITNVRSYRGADADTDHYLVISDFKVKLSARWSNAKPKGIEKIDVDRLKNEETRKRYEEKIDNKQQ
ncbi:craniofacial development protein 2-like [Acyrthosiphon pisum]|uniref:Craniofacial development protein 2-like n=1 Tax=Acyrthosiphon pisum TaxID=7029 RepID=A0A8R2B6Y0_ACYPI|nr:craniofacial development protein 2-like [Acyrthosiphon pisum]|eukprot:XP_008184296.1 PREDICTED: craniofacial development protein 2-like [Acyrthosiphon pisum]